ncbi:MAG: hypothetical protein ACK5PP_09325 [Acidimicrobiales bacterium]
MAPDRSHHDQLLTLARDLVAVANSGGGDVLLERHRLDADPDPTPGYGPTAGPPTDGPARLDPEAAQVRAVLQQVIAPDRLDIAVARRPEPGHRTTWLVVPPAPEPPLIPTVDLPGGFPAGTVLVRRNGSTVIASRDDHRRWRADTAATVRRELTERLRLLVDAPTGARIQVVEAEAVMDEPSFLLARASDLHQVRADKLLSGDDLSHLWRHRRSLDLTSGERRELLVLSALRRRMTLWLWLAELEPDQDEVRRLLRRSLTLDDRDKSDAGRSILEVAAVYLGHGDFARLHRALIASGYAHLRQAAEGWHDVDTTRRAMVDRLASGRYQRLTDIELEAEADAAIQSGEPRLIRRLPGIGFALLERRLGRRGHGGYGSATLDGG